MNGKDILLGLSNIDRKFIDEAESAVLSAPKKKISLRKSLLIAAVIAMTLLLVGCAVVYARRLQDMKIGESTSIAPAVNESGIVIETTRDVISLSGYKDSPEQLATKEWYDFTENYDTDHSKLYTVDEDNLNIPEVYQYVYGCYTQEMVNKVDEIAEKYDLILMSTDIVIQSWQQQVMFDALGIDRVCHEEKASKVTNGSGYFYPNGEFNLSFEFLLPQENDNWGYEIWANMLYTRKGYFAPKYMAMNIEAHKQWEYTTADGTDILISQSDIGALLYAEQEDAYLTVILNTEAMSEEGIPTRDDIQLAADIIDFTIRPQTADMTDIEAKLAEADNVYEIALAEAAVKKKQTVSSYAELIRVNYIDGADDKIGTASMRNYYALYDIDGNGVEELLLGRSDDYFVDFYTMKDGEIVRCNFWSHMNLCKNGVIMTSGTWETTGDKSYDYYLFDGIHLGDVLDSITYIALDDTWYRVEQGNCKYSVDGSLEYYEMEHTPITEEEALAVIEKYTPIDLEMKPISEFLME